MEFIKVLPSPQALMEDYPISQASKMLKLQRDEEIKNIFTGKDDRYVDGYPSIYDYGYGEPSGCFGINCSHSLIPYIEGVTTNTQKQYDPEKAVANEKIRNKQRYMQRQIRKRHTNNIS